MGDINLLGMIRKIKSSLSGFVGKNDKATKTKFGVVKVGDNISVSSGTISVPVATSDTYGVVKGGAGLTIESIFTGSVTKGSATANTFTAPYTDYKILVFTTVSGVNTECGNPMIVASFSNETNNANATGHTGVTALRFDSEDATKFYTPIGTGNVPGVTIYGIK